MPDLDHAVYGHVPIDLAEIPEGAVQCSPLVPTQGAATLSDFEPASLRTFTVHAPASTIERRRVLAFALRALRPGGFLTALAANDKGGTRIADELSAFGCTVEASHKRHHRIVRTLKPRECHGLDAAIADGAPRLLTGIEFWSEPGVFSWDRIDPGSQLLLDHLPSLEGSGADIGCGIGVLARAVMAKGRCRRLILIDIDRRALDLALKNVSSPNVEALWIDIRTARTLPSNLDFVVMNPPFHDGGEEDRNLGHTFITKAAAMLRPGGVLWMTANRHLPYEPTLTSLFETVEQIAQAQGFKIYSATKAAAASRHKKAPAASAERKASSTRDDRKARPNPRGPNRR